MQGKLLAYVERCEDAIRAFGVACEGAVEAFQIFVCILIVIGMATTAARDVHPEDLGPIKP